METWPLPVPAKIYGTVVLVLSLVFLSFGGAQRIRILFFSRAGEFGPTLRAPAPLFFFGTSLLGLTAWLSPALVPGMALALGLALVSFSQLRPVDFWGLRRASPIADLRVALTALLTCLIPILSILALSTGVYLVLGWPLEPQPALIRFMEARDAKTLVPFLFYALILAPAWEELFFRGTLFPWLASRMNVTQAQWLSALAFGAIHLHGPTFIPLTCLGAVLAGMYQNTRSLVPSFFLHSLFNANTCILLLLARPPAP